MQNFSGLFARATNDIERNPIAKTWVAWARAKDTGKGFFTIGTSLIGGGDIIQGEAGNLTEADYFDYTDESDRVVAYSVDKVISEPIGGFMYSVGTVILDNTDSRFTPNFDVSIGSYIKHNRPIKLFSGFRVLGGQEQVIPKAYGLTEQPDRDKDRGITKISFLDYISIIDDYRLESAKYVDQRTDEIIADILDTIGFSSDQYDLDAGLNTLGFVYYEKGTKAGDVIRDLVSAEDGMFYQDEFGVIRFKTRRTYIASPYIYTQWIIESDAILNWQEQATDIINRVEVSAKPREVQDITEVWRAGGVVEVEQGGEIEVWADFDDPVNLISDPTDTTDYIANSVDDGSGTDITSDIDVAIDKFATSAKLTITNNYAGKAFLTLLRLRGTPAIVINEIQEIYQDDDSVDEYGVQTLVIENNYITDRSFAYYLARVLTSKYKDGLRRISVTVSAIPQLQLLDKVSIKDTENDEYLNMRVMRIQEMMDTNQGFVQILYLREISDFESETPFTIGVSEIGGTDIIIQ